MGDLLAAIRQYPGNLTCANDGFGTVNFVAAELLSTRAVLEFDHLSLSGSSQAVEALRSSEEHDREADFAILLSTDIAEYLHTGQLRAIGAFSEAEYVLQNSDAAVSIPSVSGIDSRLDAVLPFGEYFGLFMPADTPRSGLRGTDFFVKSAVNSDSFSDFVRSNGLSATTPERGKSVQIIDSFASIVCWTLYDVRYLPTNPETLGIPRP